jgi:hypothetical protein
MRAWRLAGLVLAVAAFVLAAAGPSLGAFSLEGQGMMFFWVGVVCLLAAVWGRGGG